ncbi:MAG TPA: pilus assembly protein N-terminal domain-containing protein [Vicinamibacteria bacterium]|nr:pilus assembly protein N-terminal domain-containing protein [Vicinamibacteria bacterium]
MGGKTWAARLRWLGGLGLAGAVALGAGEGRAAEPTRVVVTVDRSAVLAVGPEAFSKVAVANPAIADVVVITPSQLLVNAKAVGTTSLVVFFDKELKRYDLVVRPAPVVPTDAALAPDAHGVVVQRADKVSGQLFGRDAGHHWIDLGAVSSAPEGARK